MFALLAVLLVCSSVLGDYNCILNDTYSPTAADCPYSDIVCEALDPSGTMCKNTLQSRTSDYRKDKNSLLFFSDEEIKQFIGHFKINFDKIEEELEDQKDEIEDFLEDYEEDEGITKYKNILKPYHRLIDNTYKAIYDSNASAYHTANTFNLGAASLAMNPIDYFNNSTVPRVENSIVKEIKKQCNNDADLMEKFDDAYVNDFCDIIKDKDFNNDSDSCTKLKKKFDDIHKNFEKEEICEKLAYKAELHDKWYLSDKFNQRFAPQILLYQHLVNYILCLQGNEYNGIHGGVKLNCTALYFGGKDSLAYYIGNFTYEEYWQNLTGDDKFITIDGNHKFDIWEATKYSPDYDDLVEDVSPSEKPETDGMAWWAILLIVLGSILVVAGIVVCVMYFLKKGGNGPSAPKEPKKPKTTKTKINGDNLNNNLMDDRESSDLM